jgi:signal transduction histidine kinase
MRRALRTGVLVWVGWTALALFFAVSASLTYLSTGRPANWLLSLQRTLTEWWLWALLTPLVVGLARRYPFDRRRPWRHAAIHVAAGSAIAVAKTATERAIFAWLTGFWTYWLLTTVALQFFVYAAIVAAAHGLEYYRRSREREQLEARLAEAQLQLLSAQLQPHFLFNTLNTIAELVHHDADKADLMITSLSDLLRRALDVGARQEISLGGELDLLSRYVDIQRVRFGDRLQVSYHVTEAAREAAVPVLLLQPLVENAIHHGLSGNATAGRIDVDARTVDARLRLTVRDNGRGLRDEKPSRGERVGLGNTRARLEALYGDQHRLHLANGRDGGAELTIEIPVRSIPRPT